MQNVFLIDCRGRISNKKVRLGLSETSSSSSKWPIYFINNFLASIAKQNLFVRRTFVYVILYVVDFLNFLPYYDLTIRGYLSFGDLSQHYSHITGELPVLCCPLLHGCKLTGSGVWKLLWWVPWRVVPLVHDGPGSLGSLAFQRLQKEW